MHRTAHSLTLAAASTYCRARTRDVVGGTFTRVIHIPQRGPGRSGLGDDDQTPRASICTSRVAGDGGSRRDPARALAPLPGVTLRGDMRASRSFGAPLSVMALAVAAACAVPGGAGAAVPVDCANPQAPRVPLATRALSAAEIAAAPGRTLPVGAAIPDQLVVRFDPSAGTARQAAALSVLDPDVVSAPAAPRRASRGVRRRRRPRARRGCRGARGRGAFAEPDFAVSSTAVPNDPDVPRLWPFVTDSTPARRAAPATCGPRTRGRWPTAPACGWRSSTPASTRGRSTSSRGVLRNPDDPAERRRRRRQRPDRRHARLGLRRRPAEPRRRRRPRHARGRASSAPAPTTGSRCPGLASGVAVVPVRALGAQFGSISDVVAGVHLRHRGVRRRASSTSACPARPSRSSTALGPVATRTCCSWPPPATTRATSTPSRPTPVPTTCRTSSASAPPTRTTAWRRSPTAVRRRWRSARPAWPSSRPASASRPRRTAARRRPRRWSAPPRRWCWSGPRALTAAELKDVILRSADRIPGLTKPIEQGRRLNAGRAVATVSPPLVRDARVELRAACRRCLARWSRTGRPTCACTTGRRARLRSAPPSKHVTDALSFAIADQDAPCNARFQLVADNPRGHYQSPELAPATKPRVTLSARRAAGRGRRAADPRPRARADRSIELRSALARSRHAGPARVTLRTSAPFDMELSARLRAIAGARYLVKLRITTGTGGIAEASVRRRA